MRWLRYLKLLILFISAFHLNELHAQETILTGLKSNEKRADALLKKGRLKDALELYLYTFERKRKDELNLKIARTYFQLNDVERSVEWYKNFLLINETLPAEDQFLYAESLTSTGSYEEAIDWYTKYSTENPADSRSLAKIKQLKDLTNLLEDSVIYEIHPLKINSSFSDYSPTYYQNGIVFVSNRERTDVLDVNSINAEDRQFYQTLYYSRFRETNEGLYEQFILEEPTVFDKQMKAKYHEGPVAFFPGENKMIYTKNGESDRKGSTLQLFIAERQNGKWIDVAPFPFNNINYSVSHPTLSTDGKTMYFVSNMPEGYGGTDIYKTHYVNEHWTKPVNLGPEVNTKGDESFPFLFQNKDLYFASNGHPGLGGLDIFKLKTLSTSNEIVNLGYPVNTRYDDFSIALDSLGKTGYFCSNRTRQPDNDDIYAIEINDEEPVKFISGTVCFANSSDQSNSTTQILVEATVLLIDKIRSDTIAQAMTDSKGGFILKIPYPGSFRLLTQKEQYGSHQINFVVPKRKSFQQKHDIVLVRRWSDSVVDKNHSYENQ
ncbi:tetratricopeptide repeat protein [Fulvivirgaceae bacterium BMA10]|uniref:Tetratricopeptide repeat protein n=1 Tax=Splendidivirga corallicola TaxID=3051826 RepID=A0ABT8KW97_9BACT|nr:tetratricopeptide repeat protein [Fulvivirgaceae bacterium BMA10]